MELKCPICQSKWNLNCFYVFNCPACNSEIQLKDIIPLIKKQLTNKFLESFNTIEKEMKFELNHSTWNEDIKNKTKDAKYWKGYSYGIQAFWGDFVLPEKLKWEKENE